MTRFSSQVTKTKFLSIKEHEPAQVHNQCEDSPLMHVVHGSAIKFLAPKCDP